MKRKRWQMRLKRLLSRLFIALVMAACIALILMLPIYWKSVRLVHEDSSELSGACQIANLDVLKRSSVVYTWVNGSDPCYREVREKYAGAKSVGGSRDREVGELRYSIRSWLKFAPWFEGDIFIVTPGHIPHWIDLQHPRIHFIDQDSLFPEGVSSKLPTFNTNVIEQFLYRIPGLTDVFLHFNDDYIFGSELTPHDFFTCDGGIKFFAENNVIQRAKPKEKLGIWLASVKNTIGALDRAYTPHDTYYFLKHAPYVYSRKALMMIRKKWDREMFSVLDHKLRSRTDYIVPLLHHYFMYHEGQYIRGLPSAEFASAKDMDAFKFVGLKDNKLEEIQKYLDNVVAGRVKKKCFALNDEYSSTAMANMVKGFMDKFLPDAVDVELPPNESNPASLRLKGENCTYNSQWLPYEIELQTANLRGGIAIGLEENLTSHFFGALIRCSGFTFGCTIVYIIVQKFKIQPSKKS